MKNKLYKMLSKSTTDFSESELKVVSDLVEEHGGSIDNLKDYISALELESERKLVNKSMEKNTISYQLGKSLIDAAKRKKSVRILSKELFAIYADSLSRKNKDLSNANLLHKIIILLNEQKQKELHDLAKVNNVSKRGIEKLARKVKTKNISNYYVDKFALQNTFSEKKIRIVAIMDEFTALCFDPEADIYHVTPENWQSEILEFKPDFLFIESAWQGKNGLWKTKISHQSVELINLIKFCDENKIRSVFWSKEDPVHFGTFLGVAELVDIVFTTDIDCIQKYKEHLGHDRVYLLCFAAQPTIHNPIEVYERQDKFNFAGSYYLKYPIRQRDFGVLSEVADRYKGLDIFDRNFDKPHPHYEFPECYQAMILGTLQPSEIDKAYKGYVYGINMNTIKQSQTMFARRVFEMLASNTIVLSNYSHGVRLLFGDLVICSDEKTELDRQLKDFTGDLLTQKKYRLQGLRKVLSHHTYQHRLKYVLEKSFETTLVIDRHRVIVVAHVNQRSELDSVSSSFNEQDYLDKELFIFSNIDLANATDNTVTIYNTKSELLDAINKYQEDTYIAVFNPNDSYGRYYLSDLVQSRVYVDQSDEPLMTTITKDSYFENVNGKAVLVQNKEYQQVDRFKCTKSLMNADLFKKMVLDVDQLESINNLEVQAKSFAIDCFNYVLDGASLSDEEILVSHGKLTLDEGVDFEGRLLKLSEAINVNTSKTNDLITYQDSHAFIFSADDIDAQLIRPQSKQVQINRNNANVGIKSTLPDGKFAYIYFKNIYNRSDINLRLNSQFMVDADANMDLRSVFVFLDENKEKLSHHITAVSHNHTMPIPVNCEYIQIGFKITGNGQSYIRSINIGEKREIINDFVAKSDTLVLAKQYPSYDDLYKYGFLHSRVRAYKNNNHIVDVFRITNNNADLGFREFESIDVFSGNNDNLRDILDSGQIKNIFIHLMDEKMWNIIKDYRETLKITIWLHGAEVQSWQRREFDLSGLNESEVERKKKLADNRLSFWKKLIEEELNSNITLVFVSNTFLKEVEEDLELKIPSSNKTVIHNYVDDTIFKYTEKNTEDRLKLLSIRPYAGPKYGNDITVNALLELSKYEFFKELEVNIYGDGLEFDSINEPLIQFENIHLHKRFLSHHEIAAAHKEHGVFLNPTRWDSQGVSRDEAMSSGLVVVTNKVAAVPEFISDAEGALFGSDNVKEMVERIKEIIQNPSSFLIKSKAANERVNLQCGFENTITQEIKLMDSTSILSNDL
ncbi:MULTISPECIES: glycosyltransferase family protein [Psychrobacter]|uniref:glycosyltransferase family protein n=1 Tax=Psychrobacter TaxID=497 RepID=UPI000ED59B90|nr:MULTISPECIES: glycosyltransferase [Psychrobacter]HCT73825.1 methyltransferase type 12 [Psychrobacter sp.]